MFILIFAILSFVSIFILFRYFEKWEVDNLQAIVVNYLVAASVSLLIYNGNESILDATFQSWFGPAVALGIMFMVSFYLYALSAQKSGVAITAVASKMSVVIPVIAGAALYANESLNALKWTGLGLALLSFYLIFKSKESTGLNLKLLVLPAIIFFISGANDTLMKWIKVTHVPGTGNDINQEILFVGVLFTISLITAIIFMVVHQIRKPTPVHWASIGGGALLGILNVLSATSMFLAMGQFESAFFFPVFNVSIVGLSAISGIILFREKLSTVNIIGIVLAAITIGIIALA
jgi:drug/metabolite transporter (DMT)-like permease